MPSPPVIVDFLNQDYHYKSVATQISRDYGLTLIRPAGDRTRDGRERDSDSFGSQQRTPRELWLFKIIFDNNKKKENFNGTLRHLLIG